MVCRMRRLEAEAANGARVRKAMKYLSPAKVKGGISWSTSLIGIQEDDHRVTTSRAARMATSLERDSALVIRRPWSPG